ncbi:MAG: flp pilus-assembly TadE/G-like family protein [Candidatus Nanopelagicales bacterium]
MKRLADERGAATVVLMSTLVLLLALIGAVLQMTRIAVARSQVSAAADLAALAAAQAGQCAPARAVAQANGAELVLCEQVGPDFSVRAERDVSVLAGRHVRLEALARAGPPD